MVERTPDFWKNIIRAVEAEPRDATTVQGRSGLYHPVLGLGVDDKRGRVIIIASEPDGRAAAMVQSDIQATFPDVRVIVARPAAINLHSLARSLTNMLGRSRIRWSEIDDILKHGSTTGQLLESVIQPIKTAYEMIPFDMTSQIIQVIRQLSLLDYTNSGISPDLERVTDEGTFGLQSLAESDPTLFDRELGVCPLPLYDFREEDFETVGRGIRLDDTIEILRRYDVWQYFFPPPDQIALGLIDRGITTTKRVAEVVSTAPALGHPFGDPEITSAASNVIDVIEALEHIGYISEGELTLTVTEPGKEARAVVKYKPRESLISKLLNRLNVNLDIHRIGIGGN